jgi:hypothetical protein
VLSVWSACSYAVGTPSSVGQVGNVVSGYLCGSWYLRLRHRLGGLHYHAFIIINDVALLQDFVAINVCLDRSLTQICIPFTVTFSQRTQRTL